MFSKISERSKTIKSILTGKEVVRLQNYKVPQFGPSPAKGRDAKYSDGEVMEAIQEAINYFSGDELVRHLNWSILVATQRKANNDMRTTTAGLDAASQARITLVLNLAKRQAESEVGTVNEKGELVCDRKSAEYLTSLRESITASLAKPKFADLKTSIEGTDEGTDKNNIPLVDLMAPGSLNDQDEETADPLAPEEPPTA